MNYQRLKNIPSTRDGKMIYGIIAALIARSSLNEAIAQLPQDTDAAMFGFFMTAFLVGTIVLAIVRYDTGRPLFEAVKV